MSKDSRMVREIEIEIDREGEREKDTEREKELERKGRGVTFSMTLPPTTQNILLFLTLTFPHYPSRFDKIIVQCDISK